MNRCLLGLLYALLLAPLGAGSLAAAEAKINLPSPQKEGGLPLMQALNQRRSGRSFADKPLEPQVLSNLLWAANGINRTDGKRTAPSARNWQEIDIYALLPAGIYRYDPADHTLVLMKEGDFRAQTGTQSFNARAALGLVYVADPKKMKGSDDDTRFLAGTDTGFISQNVYLFCASAGLNTVVLGMVDRDKLAQTLQLEQGQFITLSQAVGYPEQGK